MLCLIGCVSVGKKGRSDESGGSLSSIGSLNGGSVDGLSTAGITISAPGAFGGSASLNNTAIVDNSVPGLPPLTATTAATSSDPTDPFADFFK